MSSFALKIIAVISMLIDHVGAVFFPGMFIFRLIGRLAFPIFAYLISEGYRKTGDITHYMGRMLIFAFLTQPVFILVLGRGAPLNILFTFSLALYALYAYDKTDKIYPVLLAALAAYLFPTDYSFYGVLLTFIFYKFNKKFKLTVLYSAVLTLVYIISNNYRFCFQIRNFSMFVGSYMQLFSLLSFGLIYMYNGKRGLKLKYLFYIFYPGHLLILYYIKEFLLGR